MALEAPAVPEFMRLNDFGFFDCLTLLEKILPDEEPLHFRG